MIRILLDANIVLDVLAYRAPFAEEAVTIFKLCETRQVEGAIYALTIPNLVYVMRKELDPARIEDVLGKLSLIFEFADLTAMDLTRAAALGWDDFEDALQSVTAERIHADCIVTRNVRDFAQSRVLAFTSAELLARI